MVADKSGVLTQRAQTEMRAFNQDAFAYYYYKRQKPSAALQYAQKALRFHRKLGQPEHVAKSLLHVGAILSKLKRNDDALSSMKRVLEMVEDEKLEATGISAQKISLVAVCYHNIAVEHLHAAKVRRARRRRRRRAQQVVARLVLLLYICLTTSIQLSCYYLCRPHLLSFFRLCLHAWSACR